MFKSVLMILGLAALPLAADSIDTGLTTVELVSFQGIEHKQDLHFGKVYLRSGHRAQAQVDHQDQGHHIHNGVREDAPGLTSGHFHVRGTPGKAYSIKLARAFELTGENTRARLQAQVTHIHVPHALRNDRVQLVGANGLPDFTSAPGTFSHAPCELVRVGALLDMPAGTPADRYEGTYTITILFH
jgi:hypothetical protein